MIARSTESHGMNPMTRDNVGQAAALEAPPQRALDGVQKLEMVLNRFSDIHERHAADETVTRNVVQTLVEDLLSRTPNQTPRQHASPRDEQPSRDRQPMSAEHGQAPSGTFDKVTLDFIDSLLERLHEESIPYTRSLLGSEVEKATCDINHVCSKMTLWFQQEVERAHVELQSVANSLEQHCCDLIKDEIERYIGMASQNGDGQRKGPASLLGMESALEGRLTAMESQIQTASAAASMVAPLEMRICALEQRAPQMQSIVSPSAFDSPRQNVSELHATILRLQKPVAEELQTLRTDVDTFVDKLQSPRGKDPSSSGTWHQLSLEVASLRGELSRLSEAFLEESDVNREDVKCLDGKILQLAAQVMPEAIITNQLNDMRAFLANEFDQEVRRRDENRDNAAQLVISNRRTSSSSTHSKNVYFERSANPEQDDDVGTPGRLQETHRQHHELDSIDTHMEACSVQALSSPQGASRRDSLADHGHAKRGSMTSWPRDCGFDRETMKAAMRGRAGSKSTHRTSVVSGGESGKEGGMQVGFSGSWPKADLIGNQLKWKSGALTHVSFLSPTAAVIELCGRAYFATLQDNGDLYWDDGETWISTTTTSASKKPTDCADCFIMVRKKMLNVM